jgi:hypothetical protein
MTHQNIESDAQTPNAEQRTGTALDRTIACWVGGAMLAGLIAAPFIGNHEPEMACPTDVNIHDMPECK